MVTRGRGEGRIGSYCFKDIVSVLHNEELLEMMVAVVAQQYERKRITQLKIKKIKLKINFVTCILLEKKSLGEKKVTQTHKFEKYFL